MRSSVPADGKVQFGRIERSAQARLRRRAAVVPDIPSPHAWGVRDVVDFRALWWAIDVKSLRVGHLPVLASSPSGHGIFNVRFIFCALRFPVHLSSVERW